MTGVSLTEESRAVVTRLYEARAGRRPTREIFECMADDIVVYDPQSLTGPA